MNYQSSMPDPEHKLCNISGHATGLPATGHIGRKDGTIFHDATAPFVRCIPGTTACTWKSQQTAKNQDAHGKRITAYTLCCWFTGCTSANAMRWAYRWRDCERCALCLRNGQPGRGYAPCPLSFVRRSRGGAGCTFWGAEPFLQEPAIGLQGFPAIFRHPGDQQADIVFN